MTQYNIDVMGILETKLYRSKIHQVMQNKFSDLLPVNNFFTHQSRWDIDFVVSLECEIESVGDYVTSHPLHCYLQGNFFYLSGQFRLCFPYNCQLKATLEQHYGVWFEFSLPWMILGNFKSVLKNDQKCNGVEVTLYEVKEFANCCLYIGLTNVPSIGYFYI